MPFICELSQQIDQLMGMLKDVAKEQKPAFGKNANALRQKVEQAFKNRAEPQQAT